MLNSDFLKQKKLFLLDLDGTIYLDGVLFDKCVDFLEYVKGNGGKYIFLTNNSSKNVDDYIEKLTKLGVGVDKSNFFTSSQAAALYLSENYTDKKIYVLGTNSLKQELRSSNIWVTDRYEEDITCLLVGYDTELSYSKLVDACRLLSKGVDFVATNPDLLCPTSFGFVPDCGSICTMLKNATGKNPLYLGKPKPTMVNMAIKSSGYTKEQTIVIGDRLYTDIACGLNAGVTTGLVLSGETKIKDLKDTPYKPDYVFAEIKELYYMYKSD